MWEWRSCLYRDCREAGRGSIGSRDGVKSSNFSFMLLPTPSLPLDSVTVVTLNVFVVIPSPPTFWF